ncbi:glutathione S-transferase [Sphingomonas sp. DBB INV C78]|uniref:MAPEG family protein n=1 Tax=Sphingomonas sp. DBB INV C78 TaxID=3349434 RepID=UPI0036D2FA84
MTVLPITLTIAAAAALINIWLGTRVGRVRAQAKVLTGDGGQPLLVARMRAQANYIENTPFFLILLGLIELARGQALWLWLVGIAFILARILHAFGMDSLDKPGKTRVIGILVTWLALVGLAIYALMIVYALPGAAATKTVIG